MQDDGRVWTSRFRRPVVSGTGGNRDKLSRPWRAGGFDKVEAKPIEHHYASQKFDVVEPDGDRFKGFIEPGTTSWREYFDGRRVIERVVDDGVVVTSVTRDVTLLETSARPEGRTTALRETIPSDRRFKTYELALTLTDYDVQEKFDISQALINRVKAIASEDVVAAARTMQEHIRLRPGSERDLVVGGKYAQSWKAARDTVKVQAARFPMSSVTTDALFIGEKIFIYGPLGLGGWRIIGPERVASLVRLVHRMVNAVSPEVIAFALGPELTLLEIDIHDGHQILCPTIRKHIGPHADLPDSSSPPITAALTAADFARIQSLSRGILPVQIDGEYLASAVRISERHVITCEHITSTAGVKEVGGTVANAVRALSRDLWLAECPGENVTWHLRRPRVNERVVVCFRRFERVHFVGPLRIVTASDTSVTYTKHPGLKSGMSGAAVIALTDLALLGVHDGVAMSHAIGSVFSADMLSDVWTACDSVDTSSTASLVEASGSQESPHVALVNKGLSPAIKAISAAMTPSSTDSGSHAAVVSLGTVLVAPIEVKLPEDRFLIKEVGVRATNLDPKLHYRLNRPDAKAHAPLVIRGAAFGERVAVFSKDEDGLYCACRVSRVVNLDPEDGSFCLETDSDDASRMLGGLVVAMLEAAVVGIVVGVSGTTLSVVTIPDVVELDAPIKPGVSDLVMAIPELDPRGWPTEVVDGVLSLLVGERTVVADELATIGAAWLTFRLSVRQKEKAKPMETWHETIMRFRSESAYLDRLTKESVAELISLLDVVDTDSTMNGLEWPGDYYGYFFESILGAVLMYQKDTSVDFLFKFLYFDY